MRAEDKEAIAAFHWRGAPDEDAAAAAVREIAARAEAEGFAVHWGRKVLEVRPPVALDKGLGVTALLDGHAASPDPLAGALYVGDDATDLDAFRGLRSLVQRRDARAARCASRCAPRRRPRSCWREADLTIDGPDGVRELLEALL